jgi:hypothetical protein
MKPQIGVPRHDGQVGVRVQNLGSGPDRHCGDETVDQLPDGFAAHTAGAIQRRCGVIVGRRGGQHRRPPEQTTKLGEVMLVAGAGEDFHRHRIANREVVSEEEIDGLARR